MGGPVVQSTGKETDTNMIIEPRIPLQKPASLRPPSGEAMMNPIAETIVVQPPQMPPEAPVPMHARAFDFVTIRDIAEILAAPLRHRGRPALAKVPRQVPPPR